jgi:hypothetical protein
MLINMQCYLVNLLFAIMIFVCAFQGITDAERHQRKANKLRPRYPNRDYLKEYDRADRFG